MMLGYFSDNILSTPSPGSSSPGSRLSGAGKRHVDSESGSGRLDSALCGFAGGVLGGVFSDYLINAVYP